MSNKELIEKIGAKYGMNSKQSLEMHEQFNKEFLLFNLYNVDWGFLNYPGLGTFSVNLIALQGKIKSFEKKLKEYEEAKDVEKIKRTKNSLERYYRLVTYIEDYNKTVKHKRLKG